MTDPIPDSPTPEELACLHERAHLRSLCSTSCDRCYKVIPVAEAVCGKPGSAASMWSLCAACRELPDAPRGPYATHGTIAS